MEQAKHHSVAMPQGGCISLYRLAPFKNETHNSKPLLITHGTISNGQSVWPLAEHLKAAGFDCWVLEWGGHGKSEVAHKHQTFESPALYDVPVAIDSVLNLTKQPQLYWISHSGGGHLPLMHLAHFPEQEQKLAGLISIGAQATHGALTFKHKARAAALWAITHLCGHTPNALAAAGTEGEPSKLLAQWAVWNLKQKWIGKSGIDYLSSLSSRNLPTFIIAGSKDDIAPSAGCRMFFDHLSSEDKQWLECGRTSGFSKEFNHGQLVMGRAAKEEIFPKIERWLMERNSLEQTPEMTEYSTVKPVNS